MPSFFHKLKVSLWLILAMILLPALASVSVGVLILVFYREAWDVAFGVLVLSFAMFSIVGSLTTVYLLRRSAHFAQLQSDLIARISHDFRSPLTSIRITLDTIRSGRGRDPGDQERCLEALAAESERLEGLVEQVLTLRHMERAAPAETVRPQDVEVLVREALEPFSLDAEYMSRVVLVVESDLPQVVADSDAVVEAVRNLVENALKFGEGEVSVGLRYEGGVEIVVRDQNKPIPGEAQKRIFRRFERGQGDKPGTGLGLAIARQVAENHGGDLSLSVSKAGNTFTLALPKLVDQLRRTG
ncbi:MAG: HAMP domain-containing histidine kinase [Deltaproteobacteria bacterium]|nr:HAMP domain-containing histidine kinase [Deltaproteobacteria bacterium]